MGLPIFAGVCDLGGDVSATVSADNWPHFWCTKDVSDCFCRL